MIKHILRISFKLLEERKYNLLGYGTTLICYKQGNVQLCHSKFISFSLKSSIQSNFKSILRNLKIKYQIQAKNQAECMYRYLVLITLFKVLTDCQHLKLRILKAFFLNDQNRVELFFIPTISNFLVKNCQKQNCKTARVQECILIYLFRLFVQPEVSTISSQL